MPYKRVECVYCHKHVLASQSLPLSMLPEPIMQLIAEKTLQWDPAGSICLSDLNAVQSEYIEKTLQNAHHAYHKKHPLGNDSVTPTLGEKASDAIAEFGGSWKFIGSFGAVMAGWILINSVAIFQKNFDPYPYILLNLVLSCLAAIQAPIIMMSQNRQEQKDRLRSENDYMVNLKSELEIRQLHSKIDILSTHQWEVLMTTLKTQTDKLQQLIEK